MYCHIVVCSSENVHKLTAIAHKMRSKLPHESHDTLRQNDPVKFTTKLMISLRRISTATLRILTDVNCVLIVLLNLFIKSRTVSSAGVNVIVGGTLEN